MSAQLEKMSRTRGIVISALMHGIFIAGCLAFDVSKSNNPEDNKAIEQIETVSLPSKVDKS